jgi:hypothetical protein
MRAAYGLIHARLALGPDDLAALEVAARQEAVAFDEATQHQGFTHS